MCLNNLIPQSESNHNHKLQKENFEYMRHLYTLKVDIENQVDQYANALNEHFLKVKQQESFNRPLLTE